MNHYYLPRFLRLLNQLYFFFMIFDIKDRVQAREKCVCKLWSDGGITHRLDVCRWNNEPNSLIESINHFCENSQSFGHSFSLYSCTRQEWPLDEYFSTLPYNFGLFYFLVNFLIDQLETWIILTHPKLGIWCCFGLVEGSSAARCMFWLFLYFYLYCGGVLETFSISSRHCSNASK